MKIHFKVKNSLSGLCYLIKTNACSLDCSENSVFMRSENYFVKKRRILNTWPQNKS
jgi:hypothetical protein